MRLGLLAAIGYLAVHGWNGRQGLSSLMELKERQQALSNELAALRAANALAEARVRRLSTGAGGDRAYLEARARAVLGRSAPLTVAESRFAALYQSDTERP